MCNTYIVLYSFKLETGYLKIVDSILSLMITMEPLDLAYFLGGKIQNIPLCDINVKEIATQVLRGGDNWVLGGSSSRFWLFG